jgi:cell wall assembly regulator SMI1
MKKAVPRDACDRLRELLRRLETWLAGHRPRYRRALNPPATPAQLATLDAALGRPAPAPLAILLAWHNGQGEAFAGAFVENWRLMSAAGIAAAKADLDVDSGATGWRPDWVPFLDDDAGSYVCLDTGQAGTPVREFWLGNAEHPVVAASLAAWLGRLVDDLERGRYAEDPERGTLLRGDDGNE